MRTFAALIFLVSLSQAQSVGVSYGQGMAVDLAFAKESVGPQMLVSLYKTDANDTKPNTVTAGSAGIGWSEKTVSLGILVDLILEDNYKYTPSNKNYLNRPMFGFTLTSSVLVTSWLKVSLFAGDQRGLMAGLQYVI